MNSSLVLIEFSVKHSSFSSTYPKVLKYISDMTTNVFNMKTLKRVKMLTIKIIGQPDWSAKLGLRYYKHELTNY